VHLSNTGITSQKRARALHFTGRHEGAVDNPQVYQHDHDQARNSGQEGQKPTATPSNAVAFDCCLHNGCPENTQRRQAATILRTQQPRALPYSLIVQGFRALPGANGAGGRGQNHATKAEAFRGTVPTTLRFCTGLQRENDTHPQQPKRTSVVNSGAGFTKRTAQPVRRRPSGDAHRARGKRRYKRKAGTAPKLRCTAARVRRQETTAAPAQNRRAASRNRAPHSLSAGVGAGISLPRVCQILQRIK